MIVPTRRDRKKAGYLRSSIPATRMDAEASSTSDTRAPSSIPSQSIGTVRTVAVFVSAFLLFLVQPVVSKILLPEFGGSYLVWGACMVFFQAALLAGYAASNYLPRFTGEVFYTRLHPLMALVLLLALPCGLPSTSVTSFAGWHLAFRVFLLLAVALSAPVFLISMSGSIIQRWYATEGRGRNPYPLYAASNMGSFAGLLAYPLIVEPWMDLPLQEGVWRIGVVVAVVLQLLCIPRRVVGQTGAVVSGEAAEQGKRSGWIAWTAISAATCGMLMAVTNVLTFDVASIPMLWIAPLAVYLVTFVLAFARKPWNPRWLARVAPVSAVVGVAIHSATEMRLALPVIPALLIHLVVLFLLCVYANNVLVSLRPGEAGKVTAFYLALAIGGLAGSLVVNWIVPLVSRSLIEYPLALAGVFAATGMAMDGDANAGETRDGRGDRLLRRWRPFIVAVVVMVAFTAVPWAVSRIVDDADLQTRLAWVAALVPASVFLQWTSRDRRGFAFCLAVAAFAMVLTENMLTGAKDVLRLRNYYGVYKVFDRDGIRYLKHGTTLHGRQYLLGPGSRTPLAYFHPTTPAAEVLMRCRDRFRKIGMIGLGTGALAAYSGAGQTFRVFELDPDNLKIADGCFSYLAEAREKGAKLEFVFGDGRVSLRSEPAAGMDVLIVDAFNSGSIPVHLMTVEAFREYERVVGRDGVVLLHVSNRMLDLHPVVAANAREAGIFSAMKNNAGDVHADAETTYWMALTARRETVAMLQGMGWALTSSGAGEIRPWTDRRADVLGALLRGPPE